MAGKILIFGATGNIGTPLVTALVARGESVKAASRSGRDHCGAEGVRFDLDDTSTFAPAFDGVDRAYLMLPGDYPEFEQPVVAILDIAAQQGVKVVLQSVVHAEPYLNTEQRLRDSGTPFVILRPTWFIDNFHIYWLEEVKGGELRLPVKHGRTAFIYSRDIVDAAVSVLTSNEFDGQSFDLTGPEALTYDAALKVVSDVIGRDIVFTSRSVEDHVEELVSSGMSRSMATDFVHAFVDVENGAMEKIIPDLESITGRPGRTVRDYAMENRQRFLA